MRFVLFVIDTASNSGNSQEMQQIDQFNERLRQNGQLLTAAGIASSREGLLVDNRDGLGEASPGSLNGSEFYSGFWLIEAKDQQEAKELALEASAACNRRIELRAFL